MTIKLKRNPAISCSWKEINSPWWVWVKVQRARFRMAPYIRFFFICIFQHQRKSPFWSSTRSQNTRGECAGVETQSQLFLHRWGINHSSRQQPAAGSSVKDCRSEGHWGPDGSSHMFGETLWSLLKDSILMASIQLQSTLSTRYISHKQALWSKNQREDFN